MSKKDVKPKVSEKLGKYAVKLLIGIFILFIISISVGPFLWILMSSFKSNQEIISGGIGFATGFHFENYVKAFSMAPLLQFFKNSIIVAVCGTALNLAVMSMAAYAVSRFTFRGKGIFKVIFSAALFIPAAALLQPLFVTLNKLHLYDTKLGLILVYAGLGMATSFYIMHSYYLGIPKVMEEAAYIDGSGFFRTFISVILPMSTPGLATAGIMQFLVCWNEFQFALTLTTGNKSRTLPIALYYFTSQFASDYGAMFAATVLVALPSILLYVLLQKYIMSGMVSGAVKG